MRYPVASMDRRSHICISLLFYIIFYASIIHTQIPQGGIISQTTDQSCARIVDDDGNAPLDCDNATVLVIEAQPNSGGSGQFYEFQGTGQSSGGGSTINPNVCAVKGPGDCLQGQSFRVVVTVTPMITSYGLDTIGLDTPFAYVYRNCLTAMAKGSYGPYPDQMNGLCGVTSSVDLDDWINCADSTAFPAMKDPNNTQLRSQYTECALQCGWQKRKVAQNCNVKNAECLCGNTYDLKEEASGNSPFPSNLACQSSGYGIGPDGGDDIQCFPNFPQPRNLCPCARGSTAPLGSTDAPPTTNYASNIVCKNGGCQGTCGTAITLSDQVKESVSTPGNPCNTTNRNNICLNTQQNHRCLKCQPRVHTTAGDENFCYYLDLNPNMICDNGQKDFRGDLDIADICGSGNDVYGGYVDPSKCQPETGACPPEVRDVRACNCDANFLERAYWVAPICAPWQIVNPPRLEFTVRVYFEDDQGNFINGSLMTVGSGLDETGKLLPSSNATTDGFAMTRILSIDSSRGNIGQELRGLIVICDDGNGGACDVTSLNVASAGIPSSNLNTSSLDGRSNPWAAPYFNEFEAKVPLPDMLYRRNGPAAQLNDRNAWWYYVSALDAPNHGRGCGQLGWAMYGSADAATAQTMCNGPQGTCVPGVDTLFRGEIVKPPCDVAADFLNFWKNRGKSFDSQGNPTCGVQPDQLRTQNIIPRHVPTNWDTTTPNYWVHGGRLYNDADTSINFVNIRLEIAIAANFIGATVSQANGKLEPVPGLVNGCTVFSGVGTGHVSVNVINLGTTDALYKLTANCTQGIVVDAPNGVVLADVPAGSVGGENPGLVATLPLAVLTNFAPAGAFCTVNLHPDSLSITFDSLDVNCTAEFGIPIIDPGGNPNISFGPGIGNFTQVPRGQVCSVFNPFCNVVWGWGSGIHFTPLQMQIITFLFFFIVLMIMTTCVVGCITKLSADAHAEKAKADRIGLLMEKSNKMDQIGQEYTLKQHEEARREVAKQAGGKQSDSLQPTEEELDRQFEAALRRTVSPDRLQYIMDREGENWPNILAVWRESFKQVRR